MMWPLALAVLVYGVVLVLGWVGCGAALENPWRCYERNGWHIRQERAWLIYGLMPFWPALMIRPLWSRLVDFDPPEAQPPSTL